MTPERRNVFLNKYNPDYQNKICEDRRLCILGDYPTLGRLRKTFGDNFPTMWLIPQITDLSEYCGCKDKLTGRPLEQCASIIARKYHYLTISQLMLFFYMFKAGEFGKFYGAVDPLVITDALLDFIDYRNQIIAKDIEEQQELIRENNRKNAISYEEYLKRKKEYGKEKEISD